jgi:FHA domain
MLPGDGLREASRVFWLNRKPEPRSNEDTQLLPVSPFEGEPTTPLRHFHAFYSNAREWVEGCRAPGLAVVALGAGGIQAKAYLSARPAEINTAVVGRHGKAEIFLGPDPWLSLRHLAVLVYPARLHHEVRFRLVDLRTSAGFSDARGAERRAIESNAPYVAACGDYAVVFAPVTEPAAVWPRDPDRFIETFNGDVLTNPETLEGLKLDAREEPVGELVVTSREGTGAVPVSRRAIGSGILLGRSDRCDGGGLLLDRHISRVHLLIVEVAGKIYAVDTASKNGVFRKTRPECATVLESGTTISLAGRATVEWRFFH